LNISSIYMYDLIVYGATGFTGKLVAEYLAQRVKRTGENDRRISELSWAIAGRSLKKLESVKDDIMKLNTECQDVGIIVADAQDPSSIDRMVKQTKVIISTAGPFAVYSFPVVEACIRNGSHYVDITGERHFVSKIRRMFHKEAQEKQIYIVPGCGFDSIPSDLGTFFLVDKIKNEYKSDVSEVINYFVDVKGGFSGGTLNTMISSFNLRIPKEDRPQRSDIMNFGRDSSRSLWTAPFIMSSVNSPVVRDSNLLLNQYYGTDFKYKEGMGFKSLFPALFFTTLTILLALALSFPPTRYLIKRFGTQPGDGPSKNAREKGHFGMRLYAKTNSNPPRELVASVSGRGDPGYKCTSAMVAESALCLLLDLKVDQRNEKNKVEQVQTQFNLKGGVLTPASSMGTLLINRLNQSGMTFQMK